MTGPTTFLEFVCTRMFGPPAYRAGDGESYWPCPRCGAEGKFHTRPHDPRYRDRFSCYRCGTFGDEFDAVWLALPASKFPERLAIVADLRAEYERGTRDQNTRGHNGPATPSFPGDQSATRSERAVAILWANLLDDVRADGIDSERARRAVEELYDRGYFADFGRLVGRVLAYWTEFEEWRAAVDEAIARSRQVRADHQRRARENWNKHMSRKPR